MSVLEKMLGALTSAYNAKPFGNIGKLFSLFAGSLDGVQETLDTVRLWRDVDNARGGTLDRMGRNFGVAREGMPDAFYRMLIKVKVAALLSGGDIDTVISTVSELLNVGPEQLEMIELFPAKVRISVAEQALGHEQLEAMPITAKIVKRTLAAGIGFQII